MDIKKNKKERELLKLIENILNLLDKKTYWCNKIDNVFKRAFPDSTIMSFMPEIDDSIIKLLAYFLKDEHKWLDWFYWENNRGRGSLYIEIENKKYFPKNIKDLIKLKLIKIDHLL